MNKTLLKAGAVGLTTALGALSGNFIGSAIGGNTSGSDNTAMGTVGSVAGAGIGLTSGLIATNPIAVGKAGVAGLRAIGGASITGLEALGGATISAAGTAGTIGVAGLAVAGATAKTVGTMGIGFASSLVKSNPTGSFPWKLSGLGVGAVVGTGLVSSSKEAFDDFNRRRMGQMDSKIYRATPTTPSYMNNGGATGDLVFALNRNRRG